MKTREQPWRTTCRCGAALAYSCEDLETGRPANGSDYWCSNPREDNGPHDWGVVMYQPEKQGSPVMYGAGS